MCTLRHQGSGPNPERQEGPHAHCAVLTPDEKYLCVADLGVDAVVGYHFDSKGGDVTAAQNAVVAMKPGSGPRHIAFHPNGRFMYVITELSSELAVFSYDPASSEVFTELQYVSALPGGFAGTSWCAALHFSPDGRTLYASNRGHDSIAAFRADPGTGMLTPVGHTPTGGSFPREFAIDPAGRYLFAANQNSDTVFTFTIDAQSGEPQPTGRVLNVPSPACVTFVDA
jgi:6-phosphogluconolactonase